MCILSWAFHSTEEKIRNLQKAHLSFSYELKKIFNNFWRIFNANWRVRFSTHENFEMLKIGIFTRKKSLIILSKYEIFLSFLYFWKEHLSVFDILSWSHEISYLYLPLFSSSLESFEIIKTRKTIPVENISLKTIWSYQIIETSITGVLYLPPVAARFAGNFSVFTALLDFFFLPVIGFAAWALDEEDAANLKDPGAPLPSVTKAHRWFWVFF